MKILTPMKTNIILVALVCITFIIGTATAYGHHDTLDIYVNGVKQTPEQIAEIEQLTGMPAKSGNYWYNPVNGLWGLVGGLPLGQIHNPQSPTLHKSIMKNRSGGTTEFYGDGSWAYGNSNTGTGMIYNPNGGGHWKDKIWISPR